MSPDIGFVKRSAANVLLSAVLTLGIALGATGVVFETTQVDERLKEYFDEAEAWCNQKGGELVNSQAVGETGGLHCRLPNGELVEYRDGGVFANV